MRPLRIVYRGNWRVGWTTETHVTDALETLGHTVVRLQEDETSWAATETAAREADLLLWQRTWDVDAAGGHACLAHLRDAGIPTVSFHLDLYIGLDREAQIATDPFWRSAFVFTADGGHPAELAAYGVNHYWLPPAIAEAECVPGPANPRRYPHPVVFVGSHPYPHPSWRPYRDRLISALEGRYGRELMVWPRRRQPLRLRDLASLYASCEVVVGDSCHAGQVPLYWSDRIPETLGRGAFLIHPEIPGMDGWYRDGEELATYPAGDFSALCDKIDHYRAQPEERQAIAARGRGMVLARDTYGHRMQAVLDIVEAEHGWPTPRSRPAAPPATVLGRSAKHRLRATFQLAEGTTDALAVEEVWTNDDYRLERPEVAGKVVVDVGANVGAFTILAAKLGAQTVHAYEPHPANRACLEANVAANGVADRVVIHAEAVMDDPGKVYLEGAGGGVHVGDGPLPVDYDPGLWVEAAGINDVLGDLGEVGLLKVDCEGAEYRIFDGLHPEILDRVRLIRAEFHGPAMPHLAHLDTDGGHPGRWGAMVAKLANHGRLDIMGRPMVGGLLRWARY